MKKDARNVNSVLKEVLKRVEPLKEELHDIENFLDKFLIKLRKNIKAARIKAEIFLGGSFAKGTVIRKDKYDIDVFVRFDKKHKNISALTKKILRQIKNVSVIHGSRDYFRIKIRPQFFVEVVPVKKIKNPKEAENVTDLSYSHVGYIKRKTKSEKILDEIRIAKAFCYANNCYGAESYIKGFSGYALELLVYHYGGFLKFIEAMTKIKGQEIIDVEKHHKSKQHILMDINAAKLQSPIILIDPTYKTRNALAALSAETFRRFQKACRNFLRNPSTKAFEIEKINLDKIKKDAGRKNYEFVLLKAETNKQEGDIAGSKLWKFYKHLQKEISRFFEVKNSGFEYGGKKSAQYFFVVKKKKELLISGPSINDKKNAKRFKSKHKKTFVKNKKLHARLKITSTLKTFIKNWKIKHKRKIKEMAIIGIKFY